MLEPVTAKSLSDLPGIRHGFFTREGGVSQSLYNSLNCGPGSADAAERVAENRARVARHLAAEGPDIVTLYQIHSPTALVLESPVPTSNRPRADAVVTKTPGLAIGVLTADCAPVLFADPEAKIVGAAHAGWRGALAGVLEATIAEMERLGAQKSRIRAAIGPAINQAAYEVGPEFEQEVVASCSNNKRFFYQHPTENRPRFDLPGYVEGRLAEVGVAAIERQTLCTYENESKFFSYRRSQHRQEPDYGRQISAIVVA